MKFILRTEPPTVLTTEEVEEYFKKRGTIVKVLHLPATNQAVVEASTGGGKYEASQSGPSHS
jgi:hypothetical protein